MKLTRKMLQRIIRESVGVSIQDAQMFNRMLTSTLSDITEEAIQFGNNPEIDAALDDIAAGMLRLKKATISVANPLRETDEHHGGYHEENNYDLPMIADRIGVSPSTLEEVTDMILDYFEYDELDPEDYDALVNNLVYPLLLKIERAR